MKSICLHSLYTYFLKIKIKEKSIYIERKYVEKTIHTMQTTVIATGVENGNYAENHAELCI